MYSQCRSIYYLLTLACSLAFTLPAIAEEPSDAERFEEVVVFGQKIERTLQDTKESVEVFTSEMLEERNLYNLSDVYLLTPGVSGDQFGFRIRGVRNSDGAALPNRADLASVVLDGVNATGWVKSSGAGQLWDVGQVEVYRGPQSTNLGRNALAGAIVVNTHDPVYENGGSIRLGAGEYDTTEIKGHANFSLIDDVSAIRISIEENESDGFSDNITRGEDDYAHVNSAVYRLKWLYEPTDDLKAVLSYQRLKNEFGSTSTFLGVYDRDDRIALADAPADFDTEADLASLTIDYRINDNWSLTSVTGYQDGERTRFNDTDQTSAPVGSGGGITSRFSEDNNWSQELRFTYENESIRGSSGIYFSEIEAERSQENVVDLNLVLLFDDFSPGLGTVLTTNLILPVVLYQPFYDTRQTGFTNVDTSTWAAFTEWEFDLGEKWMASIGVRYDNEEQDYSTASSTFSNSVLPNLGGPFGGIPLGGGLTIDTAIFLINTQLAAFTSTVPQSDQSEDFDNFLPSAGITYYHNEEVSSSFFVKKSYRSGGSELTLLNGINDFDSEELWNYEYSLRAQVFEGRGVFNTNVYYGDWTNQQVAIQEPGTTNTAFTITVNAGESTIYGAEVSLNYDLTDNWTLYSGVAVSKTEYDDFQSPDGSEDYSGNDFSFAPELTANIGVTYFNENGFFFNASASYTDSSYADVANIREMDSYTLLNVNAGYEYKSFKIEAYGINVTDELYDVNNNIRATDGTPGTRLGAPRQYGGRVTFTF
ncbi:MAG: TonB-dependent receptor [Pseudomonadales bacterium]|nr:TonB-dependent receptor [Pseudomonadales bacterium]